MGGEVIRVGSVLIHSAGGKLHINQDAYATGSSGTQRLSVPLDQATRVLEALAEEITLAKRLAWLDARHKEERETLIRLLQGKKEC